MSQILSIVIPCYNEQDNITEILAKIDDVVLPYGMSKEIIIIDDYSTDDTRNILQGLDQAQYKVRLLDHNYGKGYAVRQGLELVTGGYIIIQDADLEYDPQDYHALLTELIDQELPVVYGSRRLKKTNQPYSHKIFYIGANILTLITNILYGTRMTDTYTCYKLFRKSSLNNINLQCFRFEFDAEITSAFLKKYRTIKEIPINYYPRTSTEGKKINIYDFFQGIDNILKFRFGFGKSQRTLLKMMGLLLGALLLFMLVLGFLYSIGFYQDHNYYSIGIALFVSDLFAYWTIKMMFFGGQRMPILSLLKDYIIHMIAILGVYFAGAYYFIELARGVGLYQGLFFAVLSILLVSGGNFLTNVVRGLSKME